MNREIACSISPVHQNTEKNGSVSELKRLFDQFDVDGDGKISPAELQNCLRIVGEDLSSEDAEDVVHSMDADGDGLLCFDEFANLVKVEDEESEEERGKFLREAFRVYEVEGEGCITPKSLRGVLQQLGQWKTVEECTAMIRRYDVNGDGVLCFDEFKIMMLSEGWSSMISKQSSVRI